MHLPNKIDPCPIADAVVELRFSANVPSNAVFGILYNKLKEDFNQTKNLPILQLPDDLRLKDPSLQYKPHHRLSSKDFVVQIGPRVINISSHPTYAGWDNFSKKIFDVLSKVDEVDIVEKFERIGIRYINFFNDKNIFENIDLEIKLSKDNIPYQNTVLRTEFKQEDYKSVLQVTNNAKKDGCFGSIIDIDTLYEGDLNNFFKKKEEIIENAHKKEKELFFNLLTKDFLTSLNPIYE